MKYTKLPHTDIKVSKICLGTMTWGEQNAENEGFEQMDYALDQGVNFFDTAELYSVPPKPETQGSTETIIGNWFKKTGNRDKVILATKIAGPAAFTEHIRTGGFKKEELHDAVNKSLKRLRTDYIDLYQLHWPERTTNYFDQVGYAHDDNDPWKDNFREVLEGLNELIKEGKIRQIGVSNENPWGVMRYLEESKQRDLPRMITIQNPYSLVNRNFEIGNAEVSIREGVGLLAYSPLAFGVLTGKYLGGKTPENARLTLFPHYTRYRSVEAEKAIQAYIDLAKENNLTIAEMALAFVNQQRFLTSNIIGATSLKQLKENIGSIHIELNEELIDKINDIHAQYPSPTSSRS